MPLYTHVPVWNVHAMGPLNRLLSFSGREKAQPKADLNSILIVSHFFVVVAICISWIMSLPPPLYGKCQSHSPPRSQIHWLPAALHITSSFLVEVNKHKIPAPSLFALLHNLMFSPLSSLPLVVRSACIVSFNLYQPKGAKTMNQLPSLMLIYVAPLYLHRRKMHENIETKKQPYKETLTYKHTKKH